MTPEQKAYFEKLVAENRDSSDIWVEYVCKFGVDGDHFTELQDRLRNHK